MRHVLLKIFDYFKKVLLCLWASHPNVIRAIFGASFLGSGSRCVSHEEVGS